MILEMIKPEIPLVRNVLPPQIISFHIIVKGLKIVSELSSFYAHFRHFFIDSLNISFLIQMASSYGLLLHLEYTACVQLVFGVVF